MTPTISVTELSRRYCDQTALDNVSLTVEPGTVTGLLGRNGAGKTTLLRIITGLEFPTTGEVKVLGAAPAENDAVLRRMVFVREEQAYPDFRVGHAIRVASWFYPNWSVVGLVTFVVAQMLVALAVVAVVTLTHHWTAFGHFFTTLQAPALTGVLAVITIALGLGGFTTMRRGTI